MPSVNEFLKKMLGGCGKESEMIECSGLIHQVIESYSSGNLTEEELTQIVGEICGALVALAAQCGKKVSHQQCVSELVDIIKGNVSVMTLSSRIRGILRKKKAGAGKQGGIGLI